MIVDEFVKNFNKKYGKYAKAVKLLNEIKIECFNNGEILTFPTSPVFQFDGRKRKMGIPTFLLDNLPVVGNIPIYFPAYHFLNDDMDSFILYYDVTKIPLEAFYWIRDFSINVMEINQYRYTLAIVNGDFNAIGFIANFLLKIEIDNKFRCDNGLPDIEKICFELEKKNYQNDILQSDEPFSKIYDIIKCDMKNGRA